MGIGQYKDKFDEGCEHNWKLHMDADSGDRKSNSIFLCNKCGTIVTMLERNSLDSFLAQKELIKIQEKATQDSLISQKESQAIQEKSVKISMWSNIIAAATVLVAFAVLLFGEGLFK